MHRRHHPKAPSHPNNHSHRPQYPRHPAPGGPSTHKIHPQRSNNRLPNRPAPSSDMPEPEHKSRFAKLREKFQGKPVTPEDVERLKLEAEHEKYRYDKKYYQVSRRKIGGSMLFGGGGGQTVTKRPVGRPPFRQQQGSMGSSLLDSNPLRGAGQTWGTGLDSMFGGGSREQGKRPVGRPKMQPAKKPFGSGLNDLFGY